MIGESVSYIIASSAGVNICVCFLVLQFVISKESSAAMLTICNVFK
jgi:hypothetical protein